MRRKRTKVAKNNIADFVGTIVNLGDFVVLTNNNTNAGVVPQNDIPGRDAIFTGQVIFKVEVPDLGASEAGAGVVVLFRNPSWDQLNDATQRVMDAFDVERWLEEVEVNDLDASDRTLVLTARTSS